MRRQRIKMGNQDIKTVMAFDFGTKRIGVAIGQSITKTARPLETVAVRQQEAHWQTVTRLIKQWAPDALVVGIPLNMDGSDQPITQQARDFADKLRETFSLTVFETDERLTTKAAREMVFNEGGYKALKQSDIDSFAAKLILEHWFRTQN